MASAAHENRLRRWCRWQVYGLPAVLLLAVTLPHLGQGDFRGDAGWYSAIGLQAWRTGELWTLWGEAGLPYFNKPPLAFWIHGLVLHVFGPSVLAARLPSVAAALGCVLLTVAIAREWSGRRTAMLSGCVLALSLEFFRRVREISLDMWQLLFLLGATLLVVRGVKRGRWGLLIVAGVPLGLALMTKPLVGLILLPMLAVWMVWTGHARRSGLLLGTGFVTAAVAALWHLSMVAVHGQEFLSQYFGAEIADRAAGRMNPSGGGDKPWWFYLQQVATRHWPWLAVVGLGVISWVRGKIVARHRPAMKLGVVWSMGWLLLLSLYADRRDRYSLPLYPGMAWIAGVWLCGAWGANRGLRRAVLRWLAPAVAVGGILLAVLPLSLHRASDPQWPALFSWVRQNGMDSSETTRPWAGGMNGAQAARLYLEFGWWPRTTRNRWGEIVATPPRGSVLLYHPYSGWAPGADEALLFESGEVKVTRLDGREWKPVQIPLR